MKHSTVTSLTAIAAITWGIAPLAQAGELTLGLDTGHYDNDTLNARFSDNPGYSLGFTQSFGTYSHFSVTGRSAFQTVDKNADTEVDITAGFTIPVGKRSSLFIEGGQWLYGNLHDGDTVVSAGFETKNARISVTNLVGVSDVTAAHLSLTLPITNRFSLKPSAAYLWHRDLSVEDGFNYGVAVSYKISDDWSAEINAVSEKGQDVRAQFQLRRSF